MLKLENWGDLFKYSKELLDDDYNHGQQLVVKTKNKSSDDVTETNSTYKQGTPDSSGESKVAFEAKFKSTVRGWAHEGVVNQDGQAKYEGKGSFLERYVKVDGLQLLLNATAWAGPSSKVPEFKVGVDFANDKAKLKFLTNVRTLVSEGSLTYLARSNFILGVNYIFDLKAQNLQKYDFGASWSPSTGAFVGLKHESSSKDQLQLGKFFLFFHHNATLSQSVGTEFALDWQKRVLTARVGFLHRFNDDTTGKFKVDQNGYLNGLLRHRINNNVTAIVSSGLSLKSVVAEQKTQSLPIGVSLDIKL